MVLNTNLNYDVDKDGRKQSIRVSFGTGVRSIINTHEKQLASRHAQTQMRSSQLITWFS